MANRITERARNDPFARFFKLPSAVRFGSNGTFVIDLPPGRYALQLADLETRLVSPASTSRSDTPVDTAVVDVAEATHAVTLRIPPPLSDEEIVGAAKKVLPMLAHRARRSSLLSERARDRRWRRR